LNKKDKRIESAASSQSRKSVKSLSNTSQRSLKMGSGNSYMNIRNKFVINSKKNSVVNSNVPTNLPSFNNSYAYNNMGLQSGNNSGVMSRGREEKSSRANKKYVKNIMSIPSYMLDKNGLTQTGPLSQERSSKG